jgi:alkanesulfonate monooxygenase SsuD/methylene tetrahydromethanopterin reductase-like flavin-dependent oxidoreductase (luciferase family)
VEKPSSRAFDDVQSVFARTLSVLHSTLVSDYRLTDEEARGAEEDLLVWFQRLSRRGGHMTERMLRVSLLSATCQYGRSFQLWKLGGEPSQDAALNALLAREPDEVAAEIDARAEGERP